jgi:subtilisin-like proprotein convertase family protein
MNSRTWLYFTFAAIFIALAIIVGMPGNDKPAVRAAPLHYTTTCATHTSSDTPLLIPDADENGVTSTVNIADMTGVVSAITVTLNVSHTWVSDLDFFLNYPGGGEPIQIIYQTDGDGHDFYNTRLVNGAAKSIQDVQTEDQPFNDIYAPYQSLPYAVTANGDWTLHIVDNYNGDEGYLQSWSMNICTTDAPLPTATPAPTNTPTETETPTVTAVPWEQCADAVYPYLVRSSNPPSLPADGAGCALGSYLVTPVNYLLTPVTTPQPLGTGELYFDAKGSGTGDYNLYPIGKVLGGTPPAMDLKLCYARGYSGARVNFTGHTNVTLGGIQSFHGDGQSGQYDVIMAPELTNGWGYVTPYVVVGGTGTPDPPYGYVDYTGDVKCSWEGLTYAVTDTVALQPPSSYVHQGFEGYAGVVQMNLDSRCVNATPTPGSEMSVRYQITGCLSPTPTQTPTPTNTAGPSPTPTSTPTEVPWQTCGDAIYPYLGQMPVAGGDADNWCNFKDDYNGGPQSGVTPINYLGTPVTTPQPLGTAELHWSGSTTNTLDTDMGPPGGIRLCITKGFAGAKVNLSFHANNFENGSLLSPTMTPPAGAGISLGTGYQGSYFRPATFPTPIYTPDPPLMTYWHNDPGGLWYCQSSGYTVNYDSQNSPPYFYRQATPVGSWYSYLGYFLSADAQLGSGYYGGVANCYPPGRETAVPIWNEDVSPHVTIEPNWTVIPTPGANVDIRFKVVECLAPDADTPTPFLPTPSNTPTPTQTPTYTPWPTTTPIAGCAPGGDRSFPGGPYQCYLPIPFVEMENPAGGDPAGKPGFVNNVELSDAAEPPYSNQGISAGVEIVPSAQWTITGTGFLLGYTYTAVDWWPSQVSVYQQSSYPSTAPGTLIAVSNPISYTMPAITYTLDSSGTPRVNQGATVFTFTYPVVLEQGVHYWFMMEAPGKFPRSIGFDLARLTNQYDWGSTIVTTTWGTEVSAPDWNPYYSVQCAYPYQSSPNGCSYASADKRHMPVALYGRAYDQALDATDCSSGPICWFTEVMPIVATGPTPEPGVTWTPTPSGQKTPGPGVCIDWNGHGGCSKDDEFIEIWCPPPPTPGYIDITGWTITATGLDGNGCQHQYGPTGRINAFKVLWEDEMQQTKPLATPVPGAATATPGACQGLPPAGVLTLTCARGTPIATREYVAPTPGLSYGIRVLRDPSSVWEQGTPSPGE